MGTMGQCTRRVRGVVLAALLVALVSLLWSHWTDAWSVEAWRRGSDRPRRSPIEYGYTVWAPAFVLALGLAACGGRDGGASQSGRVGDGAAGQQTWWSPGRRVHDWSALFSGALLLLDLAPQPIQPGVLTCTLGRIEWRRAGPFTTFRATCIRIPAMRLPTMSG